MSHVKPLGVEDAPENAQELLRAIKDKYGEVLNIFGTMAHQPDVLKGVVTINDGLQNDLPPKIRELAYYLASQLNDCKYCTHYHRQAAKKAGLTDEQLDEVTNPEGDAFSDLERAVISYSEQLTKTAAVDNATVESLKQELSEKQLVTLAATVALANFTNRFNHGLAVELP